MPLAALLAHNLNTPTSRGRRPTRQRGPLLTAPPRQRVKESGRARFTVSFRGDEVLDRFTDEGLARLTFTAAGSTRLTEPTARHGFTISTSTVERLQGQPVTARLGLTARTEERTSDPFESDVWLLLGFTE